MLPTKRPRINTASGALRWPQEAARSILPVLILLTLGSPVCAASQPDNGTSPAALDPTEVVWRMVAQNETRAHQLRYYTSRRRYHLEFHGLGRSMAADMHVQATYVAGEGKSFQVIDESGSHLLLDHVLKKLLETERDDSLQRKSALTPANYNFTFDSQANEDGRLLYVFSVEPKVKNKLLYRGKIWIDGQDFAVVRVEAQPAENPSFWIKSTDIHHVYTKCGEFWLPESNRSDSRVRLGGSAALTIDYGTYQFDEPHATTPSGSTDIAVAGLHSRAVGKSDNGIYAAKEELQWLGQSN